MGTLNDWHKIYWDGVAEYLPEYKVFTIENLSPEGYTIGTSVFLTNLEEQPRCHFYTKDFPPPHQMAATARVALLMKKLEILQETCPNFALLPDESVFAINLAEVYDIQKHHTDYFRKALQ